MLPPPPDSPSSSIPADYDAWLERWEAWLDANPSAKLSVRLNQAPDLLAYEEVSAFLGHWYRWRCVQQRARSQPRYSYRAFGRASGQGNELILYHLITGRRNLTVPLARAIAGALGLVPRELDVLVLMARRDALRRALAKEELKRSELKEREHDARGTPRHKAIVAVRNTERRLGQIRDELRDVLERLEVERAPDAHERLVKQKLRVLSSWYHAAIYELARCEGFRWEADWVARTLRPNISPEQAEDALSTLAEVGMLQRLPDGGVETREVVLHTGEEIDRDAVRAYYEGVRDRAGDALDALYSEPGFHELSRLGALTVAIPSSLLPQVVDRFVEFHTELMKWMDTATGDADRVFQTYLHLFPLTEQVTRQPPDDGR